MSLKRNLLAVAGATTNSERMCETDVNSFAEGKCYAILSVLTQDLRSRGVEKLRSMVRHYHISHRRTLLFEPD